MSRKTRQAGLKSTWMFPWFCVNFLESMSCYRQLRISNITASFSISTGLWWRSKITQTTSESTPRHCDILKDCAQGGGRSRFNLGRDIDVVDRLLHPLVLRSLACTVYNAAMRQAGFIRQSLTNALWKPSRAISNRPLAKSRAS